MPHIEIGSETNEDQFAQVVESFFRVHPGANEADLQAYILRESNLDPDAFNIWRKKK